TTPSTCSTTAARSTPSGNRAAWALTTRLTLCRYRATRHERAPDLGKGASGKRCLGGRRPCRTARLACVDRFLPQLAALCRRFRPAGAARATLRAARGADGAVLLRGADGPLVDLRRQGSSQSLHRDRLEPQASSVRSDRRLDGED